MTTGDLLNRQLARAKQPVTALDGFYCASSRSSTLCRWVACPFEFVLQLMEQLYVTAETLHDLLDRPLQFSTAGRLRHRCRRTARLPGPALLSSRRAGCWCWVNSALSCRGFSDTACAGATERSCKSIEVVVIQDEVKQHAHQIDDVGFLLGQFVLLRRLTERVQPVAPEVLA